jgi:hypothetical protein
VCFVFFLETIQTGLSGADVYYWFVSGYGDIRHLASPYAAAFDVPIMESVVSLIVEFFFAHRIWALGVRWSKWFCLLICLVGQSQASLESNRSSLMHFLSAPFLMQQRHLLAAFT